MLEESKNDGDELSSNRYLLDRRFILSPLVTSQNVVSLASLGLPLLANRVSEQFGLSVIE